MKKVFIFVVALRFRNQIKHIKSTLGTNSHYNYIICIYENSVAIWHLIMLITKSAVKICTKFVLSITLLHNCMDVYVRAFH